MDLAVKMSSPCIMSVQYTGGCAVHRGISLSTLGGVQYTGGISLSTPGRVQYTGGYHEYTGGCSIHWGDTMSTVGGAQYTGVSIQNQLFSQYIYHDIPPVYGTPRCTARPPGVLHRHYAG